MAEYSDTNVQRGVYIAYILGSALFVVQTLFAVSYGFTAGSLLFLAAAIVNYLNWRTTLFESTSSA